MTDTGEWQRVEDNENQHAYVDNGAVRARVTYTGTGPDNDVYDVEIDGKPDDPITGRDLVVRDVLAKVTRRLNTREAPDDAPPPTV